MPYKKPVQNLKKYFSPFYSPWPPYSMSSPAPAPKHDPFGIPLPNEKESFPGHAPDRFKFPNFSGIMEYIRAHVKIEDIILVGLIILMLDEAIEDDLLLIILVYILLF